MAATYGLTAVKSFRAGDKVVPVGPPVGTTYSGALTIATARRIGQEFLTIASHAGSKRYHCTVDGVTEIYRASDLRLLRDIQDATRYKVELS